VTLLQEWHGRPSERSSHYLVLLYRDFRSKRSLIRNVTSITGTIAIDRMNLKQRECERSIQSRILRKTASLGFSLHELCFLHSFSLSLSLSLSFPLSVESHLTTNLINSDNRLPDSATCSEKNFRFDRHAGTLTILSLVSYEERKYRDADHQLPLVICEWKLTSSALY